MQNNHSLDSSKHWQDFVEALCTQSNDFVNNAPFQVTSTLINDEKVPVIWNTDNDPQTSWIASLLNSYGPYARAELELIDTSRYLRPFLAGLSYVAQLLMQISGLGSGIFLDNWLVATNLYPSNRSAEAILITVKNLVKEAYDKNLSHLPIIIRSLTPIFHADIINKLEQNGFLLLPIRQVWIASNLHDPNWRRHADVKRDLHIEKKYASQSVWVAGTDFTDDDFERAFFLYNQLYREKYPKYNPAYSVSFFKTAVQTGFMQLYGLRFMNQSDSTASAKQSLSGIVGIIRRENVFATPVLGYDLEQPMKHGLYRRLMLKGFLETEKYQGILHCSAGAGNFKAQRGAQFYPEFAAIWMQHLPSYRQTIFKTLSKVINTFITPYAAKKRF
jgi:hypothetical protein